MSNDYIATNKALWAARTVHHVTSGFYTPGAFKEGATSLKDIELALLGDIKGKHLLHLQCHFGQDSLSLARMGAHVTGLDFSEEAITEARRLSEDLDIPATFICADVYNAAELIVAAADIVFTSYGTIAWLPDLDRWADTIARCLKPGGRLIFVEFHPALWMFDSDFTKVTYSYFNTEPIIEMEEGTYADKDAPISMPSITWNHSLSEVYNSLQAAGLTITHFHEYDYSPYAAFPNVVEISPSRYNIQGMEGKLPMVYSLQAIKGG